jgi:LuxR family transcriptional regulator, maltose regulon positive regulatory protein
MVARPRLLEFVDLGVQGPLTLVAAPAGAGKSALLSSWTATGRSPGPVAWLSLDGGAGDRREFASAMLATLTHATGDARLAALAGRRHEPASVDDLLAAVVEALSERDEPVVLVLDDFHEVADVVHEDVERLVRFPPPALRLVIVTRADPPIGLGRLRLDGRLTEIRARDLAFTLDEARELFVALDVPIDSEQIMPLWEVTEGWAAGLCLAALSVRAHPDVAQFVEQFVRTDATVSDYLVSEVLARQPAAIREFLLRTSIVDLVCGDLADALTDGSDGQQMLLRLEHAGIPLTTVALDEHAVWHRYHPLFAELLRAELRAQRGGEVAELHRRAAAWLAENADPASALRHVAAGCAWDLGAELVIDSWVDLLIAGEIAALRPVLEAMPPERVAACPELSLAFAAAMLALDEEKLAEPLLDAADGAEALVAPERRSHVAAALAAVGLYAGRLNGDPARALAAARELLTRDRVLETDETAAGLRGLVLAQLGILELWTGDVDAAVGHLERARAVAAEGGGDRTALIATAYLALANAFRGEFARARRHAEEALVIAERGGWARTEPAAAAYSALVAVCIQRDELDEAERLLNLATVTLRDTRERPLRAVHALNRVLLLSGRGEHAAALDVLQAAREQIGVWPLPAPMLDFMTANEGLLCAAIGAPEAGRALLERGPPTSLAVANATATLDLQDGEPAAARAALAAHLEHAGASTGAWLPERAEAWLLDALALDALAEHEHAAGSLERALDLAEPAGLRRVLVVHGAMAGSLLRRHIRYATAHPAMVADAIQTIERRCHAAQRPARTALAEPLSEREQAILRYLPTMMSNQEIAGELFVSVNTVKTHLKAIYRKLDAAGRREAVQHARELGLMP